MIFFNKTDFIRCGSLLISCLIFGGIAEAQQTVGEPTDRERQLTDRIRTLEEHLAALEARLPAVPAQPPVSAPQPAVTLAAAAPAAPATPPAPTPPDGPSLPGFLAGTTINGYLDGYYGWNFNRPLGRVNLLRANDVSSNSFTLNQADLVIERAADAAAGRRLGYRVDLMFGQETETVQGGAQNELRPQVYRNLFQAYGTYIVPVGSGLQVDFGKFASSLGYETNWAKDQFNYSHSYYFNYLPFYHMGLRSTYKINEKVSVQYWLVNGANQTEDFNESKSNAFLFTLTPTKSVTWNVNYYFGQEGRDLVPNLNPGIPVLPTQPGLSTTPASPHPTGREHIFDTYATWNATNKLTLAGEADYVVNRNEENSSPSRVTGGVAYAKYQLTPMFNMAGRFEYLSDRGGLFTGVTQAIKDSTLTATFQPLDGFQVRAEFRRDFSNQAFFLTEIPGRLKKQQNTATVGLLWWFGGKQGAW